MQNVYIAMSEDVINAAVTSNVERVHCCRRLHFILSLKNEIDQG
jgi:hypothetical protein